MSAHCLEKSCHVERVFNCTSVIGYALRVWRKELKEVLPTWITNTTNHNKNIIINKTITTKIIKTKKGREDE